MVALPADSQRTKKNYPEPIKQTFEVEQSSVYGSNYWSLLALEFRWTSRGSALQGKDWKILSCKAVFRFNRGVTRYKRISIYESQEPSQS